ncbi:MAG: tetratricopeptide repeat protein, partial [bacterium]
MTEKPPTTWKVRNFLVVLLLVVIALTYWPAFHSGFLSDDHHLIAKQAEGLSSPASLGDLLTKGYTWGVSGTSGPGPYYRPWISLTFWLDGQLFGLKPWGYHLSNLLVHIANCILVLLLLSPLVGFRNAYWVALLFGVAPAAMTSVGWISGRTDLWAAFFTLLFLIAFLKGLQTAKFAPMVGALAAFMGALLSKETALIAPVIALLVHYAVSSRKNVAESLRAFPWKSYALLLVPIVLFFALRWATLGQVFFGQPMTGHSAGLSLLAEKYLKTAFSALVPLHYHFFEELSWSASGGFGLALLAGWILLLVMLAFLLWGFLHKKLFAVGALWYGIVLFPAYALGYSFAPIASFYGYLGLPGLWLFVVVGLSGLSGRLFPQNERMRLSILWTPLVLVFAVLTFLRLPILRGDFLLWSHMMERFPTSSLAAANLSEACSRAGDQQNALRWAWRLVELDPNAWVGHHRLAEYFIDRGDTTKAGPHIRVLCRIAPDRYETPSLLARYYFIKGSYDEAIQAYSRAFLLGRPQAKDLLGNGNALAQKRDYEGAIRLYLRALAAEPEDAGVYHNLCVCHSQLGQTDMAINACRKAVQLNPEMLQSYELLVKLYVQKGMVPEA